MFCPKKQKPPIQNRHSTDHHENSCGRDRADNNSLLMYP